jgi:hypothetical protein
MSKSLDAQYKKLFGIKPEFGGLVPDQKSNLLDVPTGFHHTETASGEYRGMGFYCPDCKLHVVAGLNEESAVKHCGKVTRYPKGLFGFLLRLGGLDTYRFKRFYF